jgi:hypothetical protein
MNEEVNKMFSKEKKPFGVYMAETKEMNRWEVFNVGLFGAFLGICFATVYFMLSIL